MGPNPNGLRSVSCDRAMRYSGLGVRSVGLAGYFLEKSMEGFQRNKGKRIQDAEKLTISLKTFFFSERRGDCDKEMCFNEHGRSLTLTFGRMLGNSKSTSLKKID